MKIFKIISLKFFMFLFILTNSIVHADNKHSGKIKIMTLKDNDGYSYNYGKPKLRNDLLTSITKEFSKKKIAESIKDVIKFVEETIKDTCVDSVEIAVSINTEGKAQLVFLGLAGSINLTVINSQKNKICSQY
ncbi:hypothetical protein MRY82_02755 [bacterium]|nr:hypothetical protein [bacterium]